MQRICGYCGARFDDEAPGECRYHPRFYFPYDIDTDGDHEKGWQCCGAVERDAPGCVLTRHRADVRRVHEPGTIAYHYEVIEPS